MTDALVRRVFAEETDRIVAETLEAMAGAAPGDLARATAETEAAASAAQAVFLEADMRAFLALKSPLAELITRGDGTASSEPPTLASGASAR